jgi:hypothetical protein
MPLFNLNEYIRKNSPRGFSFAIYPAVRSCKMDFDKLPFPIPMPLLTKTAHRKAQEQSYPFWTGKFISIFFEWDKGMQQHAPYVLHTVEKAK